MSKYPFLAYKHPYVHQDLSLSLAENYFQHLRKRRSVRDFSDIEVSKSVIEHVIRTAATAPSGANKQPWTFAAISNKSTKAAIRYAAEKEEALNYSGRMSDEWLRDLAPLGTNEHKPFLEVAPWLIVVFKKAYEIVNGEKHKNYYVNESVGIATGFLLAAIHQAGLVALTHTPSPMDFLGKLLNRPNNERAHLLIPVGYAAQNATVPDIARKPLNEISVWYE